MRTILTSTALFLSISLSAQKAYQVSYGDSIGDDESEAVVVTSDGGYAVAGHTHSYGAGSGDFYLVKTDWAGVVQWSKTYGGAGDDFCMDMQQTSDDGYILVGNTSSYGFGNSAIYLIKTDMNGDTMWTKTYGGTDLDWGRSVKQTSDGGYIVGGNTRSYGNGGLYDAYLLRLNSSGDTLWTKTYGGGLNDYVYEVVQTPDSGFITGGRTFSYGQGFGNAYVIRTDASGDTLWTRVLGGGSTDYGNAIINTSDGGYLLIGQGQSFAVGDYDGWVTKLNANGNVQWSLSAGSAMTDMFYQGVEAGPDTFLVVGATNGLGAGDYDMWLCTIDAASGTGVIIDNNTYGGGSADQGFDIEAASDGGYILSGWERSFGIDANAYVVKIDAKRDSYCNEMGHGLTSATAAVQVNGGGAAGWGNVSAAGSTVSSPTSSATIHCDTALVIPQLGTTGNLVLYPNPTKGELTIQSSESITQPVQVLDIMGRVVYAQPVTSTAQLDLGNLLGGTYIVRITHASGTAVRKMIVE